MKKYIRYAALGTMIAISSGFMTEANAFGRLKKSMACSASLCGSTAPEALEKALTNCFPDLATARKNPNCGRAFFINHCQGIPATDRRVQACNFARSALTLKTTFNCDEAAAKTPSTDVLKYCFDPDFLKQVHGAVENKYVQRFLVAFYKEPNRCMGDGVAKYKKQCAIVRKTLPDVADIDLAQLNMDVQTQAQAEGEAIAAEGASY